MLEVTGDLFRRFATEFAPLIPPDDRSEAHGHLVETAAEMQKSVNFFMNEPGPNWTVSFLYSRRAFCHALYSLYNLRQYLPAVSKYFESDSGPARSIDGTSAPESSSATPPTGFIHR